MLLLLACGGSLEPVRSTSADVKVEAPAGLDASCGWAAVQVGVAVQQAHDEMFDSWLDGFASRSDLPLPSACVGRVAPWVRTTSPTSVEVCARVLTGADAGRAWCADEGGVTWAQADLVGEVVEPGPGTTDDLGAVYRGAALRLLGMVGPSIAPVEVFVAEDGHTTARLTGAQASACAERLARELWSAERSHEAAFDTYTADAASIYAFDLLVSCPAYVAGRIAAADERTFTVEGVVLEGVAAGSRFEGDDARPVHATGRVPVSREALAAAGWWMGEAP